MKSEMNAAFRFWFFFMLIMCMPLAYAVVAAVCLSVKWSSSVCIRLANKMCANLIWYFHRRKETKWNDLFWMCFHCEWHWIYKWKVETKKKLNEHKSILNLTKEKKNCEMSTKNNQLYQLNSIKLYIYIYTQWPRTICRALL